MEIRAGGDKSGEKIFWENDLAPALGLAGGRMSKYLVMRAVEYVS
jgi:hypothetical protein